MPNTACVVSDELPQADPEKACDDETVLCSNLEITKVADRSYYTDAGQVINYTVIATNVGKAPLTDVDITDTLIRDLNDSGSASSTAATATSPSSDSTLPPVTTSAAPRATRPRPTTSTRVKNPDLKVNNSACAVSKETPEVCAKLDIPLAKLNIQKTSTPASYAKAGDKINVHGDGDEHRPGRPVWSGHHR